MASFLTASLVLALLVSSFSVSAGQRIVRVKPGDDVTLTCRAAENKDVIVVEWSRTDLESDQYVLLYRDRQSDPEGQPPSFRNRVSLLDVKNGDVSLVLKNVTTDDRGTYECRVFQRGNNRRKIQVTEPISIIDLRVELGQRITVKPGDNITLTCRAAENKDVIVVEWSRTDLESDHVLLYRDNKLNPELQSLSFRNRVDLLDVKNRDVSLVLKNVNTDDTGTYECRVVQRGDNRRKRSLLDTEPISTINLRVEAGQRIITAEPGDNVILPCGAAENKDVGVVEWRRTDLGSDQHVRLHKDKQIDPDGQSPSFINRVDLLDMTNENMSLALKNVTTDDRGTYECRVVQGGNNRRKRSLLDTDPISTVNLRVEAGNKEGGNKDGLKEDGGNKDGGNKDGGSWTGLIVGLSVCAVVALLGAAVFYKRSRDSSTRSQPPPAAADAEKKLTGPDE